LTALAIGPRLFAPPDTRLFVPIADASRLLGIHAGSLARTCRQKLASAGAAILSTPADGGQPQWFIARSHDYRLRADPPQNATADLSRFSDRQRDQVLQKLRCVDRLRQVRTHGTRPLAEMVPGLIAELRREFPSLRLSRSSLYGWDRLYNSPADAARLADYRGGDRRHMADPAAWAAFRDLYLHENAPAIRQCWKEVRRLAAESGWAWCNSDSCRRLLRKYVSAQDEARHRTPAIYRQQLAPFIQQPPEAWKAGELWIGDHKQLDLICLFGQVKLRPWLTTWMDWRTRRVTGWVLSDSPNSTTILGALRHGLMDPVNLGGPGYVWIDNGKDYDAWVFHGQTKAERKKRIKPAVDEPRSTGIFNALKIEAHFSTPFNPNGKSRLERWFRTLDSFARTFDTYTGSGLATKPERLKKILDNPRAIPTFEVVQQRIAAHIIGDNASADHDMDDLVDGDQRLSPDEAFAAWCDTKRVLADPGALDLLMMQWHQPIPVGRNGITIRLLGRPLHYGQFETALSPFKGLSADDRPKMHVSYDPHDLRSIRVYDSAWRFVCAAGMNQTGGLHGGDAISVAHVAELNRQKAQYEKSQRHVAEIGITAVLTDEERVAELAALSAQSRRDADSGERSLKIVQTPLDGQSKQIDRQRLRIAVGAESAPFEPSAVELLKSQQRKSAAPETGGNPFDLMRGRNAW
jgi:putative transposase